MSRVRERPGVRVWSRICLGCGYDGPEMQARDEEAVFLCPCCGEDLYARRPMSYAEMEGLVAAGPRRARVARRGPRRAAAVAVVSGDERGLRAWWRAVRRRLGRVLGAARLDPGR